MRFKPLHNGERFDGLRLREFNGKVEWKFLNSLYKVLKYGGRIEITPRAEVAITESFNVQGSHHPRDDSNNRESGLHQLCEPPEDSTGEDFGIPFLEGDWNSPT